MSSPNYPRGVVTERDIHAEFFANSQAASQSGRSGGLTVSPGQLAQSADPGTSGSWWRGRSRREVAQPPLQTPGDDNAIGLGAKSSPPFPGLNRSTLSSAGSRTVSPLESDNNGAEDGEDAVPSAAYPNMAELPKPPSGAETTITTTAVNGMSPTGASSVSIAGSPSSPGADPGTPSRLNTAATLRADNDDDGYTPPAAVSPSQEEMHAPPSRLRRLAYFVGATDKLLKDGRGQNGMSMMGESPPGALAAAVYPSGRPSVGGLVTFIGSPSQPGSPAKDATEAPEGGSSHWDRFTSKLRWRKSAEPMVGDEKPTNTAARKRERPAKRVPVLRPCARCVRCTSRNAVFGWKVVFPLLGVFFRRQGRSIKEDVRISNLVPGWALVECLAIGIGQGCLKLGNKIKGCRKSRRSMVELRSEEAESSSAGGAEEEQGPCEEEEEEEELSGGEGTTVSWEDAHHAAATPTGSVSISMTNQESRKRRGKNSGGKLAAGSPLTRKPTVGLDDDYPTVELVKKSILFDAGVGLSVGAMCIPQGMSYALLANLPPQFGLYNNMWFPLIYFFFGTSRHALTGVSAIENIMIGDSITKILGSAAPAVARVNCASALCLVSGMLLIGFRFVKLAVIADLLADPVLSGFSTGAAFIVGTSQVKYCLGLGDIKSDWGVPKTWVYILQNLPLIELAPVCISLGVFAVLWICKAVNKKHCRSFPLPGPLLVVILGCLISYLMDINSKYDVKIVGTIPSGLAGFKVPTINWGRDEGALDPSLGFTLAPKITSLLLESLKLSLVFYVIHVSISKSIAVQKGYRINAAQELVAFSMCDSIGAFFQCYPNCTSISRTSVAATLGAVTAFHGLFCTLVVLCVILFLTGALYYLPMACLGAIVLFSVAKMAEFHELKRLWRLQMVSWVSINTIGGGASSPDLLLWLVTFLSTTLLGASEGILISVCLSLLWRLMRIMRPGFFELGRLPGTQIYRSRDRFVSSATEPNIFVYRIDAPITFCNANFLEDRLTDALKAKCLINPVRRSKSSFADETAAGTAGSSYHVLQSGVSRAPPAASPVETKNCAIRRPKEKPEYDVWTRKYLILDCSSVNDLDVTAIAAIKRISCTAAKLNTTLAFANWKGSQRDFLFQANFYEIVPPRRCFLSIHDAVLWARSCSAHYNGTTFPLAGRADEAELLVHHTGGGAAEVLREAPPLDEEDFATRALDQGSSSQHTEGLTVEMAAGVRLPNFFTSGGGSAGSPRVLRVEDPYPFPIATSRRSTIAAVHSARTPTPPGSPVVHHAPNPVLLAPLGDPRRRSRQKGEMVGSGLDAPRISAVMDDLPLVLSPRLISDLTNGGGGDDVSAHSRKSFQVPGQTAAHLPMMSYEWDGLSGVVPNVRFVWEKGMDGSSRAWGYACDGHPAAGPHHASAAGGDPFILRQRTRSQSSQASVLPNVTVNRLEPQLEHPSERPQPSGTGHFGNNQLFEGSSRSDRRSSAADS